MYMWAPPSLKKEKADLTPSNLNTHILLKYVKCLTAYYDKLMNATQFIFPSTPQYTHTHINNPNNILKKKKTRKTPLHELPEGNAGTPIRH